MEHSVLIVDDSKLARALLKKTLTEIDNVVFFISEASNGQEALSLCRTKPFDFIFLDLTMPQMNGYEVLQQLRKEKINIPVFVVSADIQPKAKERVLELGAKAFIRKNIDTPNIKQILVEHQILIPKPTFTDDHYEVLREIINIGMGQAGAALAELLDTFVELTVPHVTIIAANQVSEIVENVMEYPGEITAVRQAFYNHLNGEAIVIYSQEGCKELGDLLGYDKTNEAISDQELLLDVGNILVGACLNGISMQLSSEHSLSFSSPSILGENTSLSSLFITHDISWKSALLLKVAFRLENRAFSSHILVFMPEQSIHYICRALDKWIEDL